MNKNVSENNNIITKLTALWALNESGLGGMMFALHIPLTGFFVGGFALILISLIAFYSSNDFRQIIRATVLVLMIKATASPQSPPPAYIAVAFQGLTAALLFSTIRNHKIAVVLLAVLAMVESSLQKIIVMTLIYGKSIWNALDKAIEGIGKDFGLNTQIPYSFLILAVYVLLHVVWGIMLALFAGRLPHLIDRQAGAILTRYQDIRVPEEVPFAAKAKRKTGFWLRFFLILSFVVLVFLLSDSYAGHKILYIVARSVAAVLLLFFVLRPLLTWLIQLWLKKQRSSTKQEASAIMDMIPALKSYVKPSWQMAKSDTGKNGRLRYFILSMIILSLYGKQSQ